jgi:hypothetical protein
MTNPGFGSDKVTRRGSLQQFVEVRVLRAHLCPANRFNHYRGSLGRAMSTSGRRNQPVIVIRRHQDQFPPTMSRDLYGLTPSSMLDLAEIALELDCCSLGHIRSAENRLSA